MLDGGRTLASHSGGSPDSDFAGSVGVFGPSVCLGYAWRGATQLGRTQLAHLNNNRPIALLGAKPPRPC